LTIRYALSRLEVVRAFLIGVAKSRRLLILVLFISLWPAFVWLVTTGALSRGLKAHDIFGAIWWVVITFWALLLWIFLTAKTKERTLVISQEGIYTEIGKIRATTHWKDIKSVIDTKTHILIAKGSGNSFFIPCRAFATASQRAEFLAEVEKFRA
jgi:hypothetical protein